MTIPQSLIDLTPDLEAFVAALRTKQRAFRKFDWNKRGKFWRGSTNDPADHSRVRKIVEVPTQDPETGETVMRREYAKGPTLTEFRDSVKLPASVEIDIVEYQHPERVNGRMTSVPGWYVVFTAKPGGGHECAIDGEGPETHGFAWRPTAAEPE